MNDPLEFIIRVINDQARQALQEFADAGRKAARDVAAAFGESNEAIDQGGKKAAQAAAQATQQGAKAAQQAVQGVGQQAQQAARGAAGAIQQANQGANQAIQHNAQAAAQEVQRVGQQAVQAGQNAAQGIQQANQQAAQATQQANRQVVRGAMQVFDDMSRQDKENLNVRAKDAVAVETATQKEMVGLREKAAAARIKIDQEVVKAESVNRKRGNDEMRAALAERLQAQGGASQQEKELFDQTTEAKRKGLAEEIALGGRTAKDLVAFDADAAKTRKVLHADYVNDANRLTQEKAKVEMATGKLEVQETRNQLRDMLRDKGKATAEEKQLFEQWSREKRQAFVEDVRAGKRSASDVLEFDRETARSRRLLNQQSFGETNSSLSQVVQGYTNLRIATQFLGGLKDMWVATAQSIKEANDHIDRMVSETEKAVASYGELAAMMGREANPAFAAEQAMKAQAAGVTTADYAESGKAFMNYVGQVVRKVDSGETMTPDALQAEGKKITSADAEQLIGDATTYGVGKKRLKPEEAMMALGAVVKTAPAGTDNKELLRRYAQVLSAGQGATGDTSHAVGAMADYAIMNSGDKPTYEGLIDAVSTISQMSEGHKGDQLTYGMAFDRARRDMEVDAANPMDPFLRRPDSSGMSRQDELGVTPQMSRRQAAAAIRSAWQGSGDTKNAFLGKYFPNQREMLGVLNMTDGANGGFARIQADMDAIGPETVPQTNATYRKKEYLGRIQGAASDVDAATYERAGKYTDFEEAMRHARARVINDGKVEIPDGYMDSAIRHGGIGIPGVGGVLDQEARGLVGHDLTRDLAQYQDTPKYKEFAKSLPISLFPWEKRSYWNFAMRHSPEGFNQDLPDNPEEKELGFDVTTPTSQLQGAFDVLKELRASKAADAERLKLQRDHLDVANKHLQETRRANAGAAGPAAPIQPIIPRPLPQAPRIDGRMP